MDQTQRESIHKFVKYSIVSNVHYSFVCLFIYWGGGVLTLDSSGFK